jgi:archaellum component FlaG (FlaF/FlaG flagellin family)
MKTKPSPPFIFLLKNKKAISNILAGVLLILITLIIGGLFFIFGRTMFHSLSTTRDFEILDANLLLSSSGATLQITVKNTGSARIRMDNVYIETTLLGNWSSPDPVFLDAGQMAGRTFNPSGSFVAGQKVIVKVVAKSDSNRIEKITQVIVQG